MSLLFKSLQYVFFTSISIYTIFAILFVIFGGFILPEFVYLYRISSVSERQSTSSLENSNKNCDILKFDISGQNIDIQNTIDHHEIASWYLPCVTNCKKTVVIYAHGNAKDRCSKRRIGNYRVLLEAGYDVLAMDYGGFSNSTLSDKSEFFSDFLNNLKNQYFNQPTPDTLSNDVFSAVEYRVVFKNVTNSPWL